MNQDSGYWAVSGFRARQIGPNRVRTDVDLGYFTPHGKVTIAVLLLTLWLVLL